MVCFDSLVLDYEEDIRKSLQQRTLPGWNYCTFFILKVYKCTSTFIKKSDQHLS
jgi:serine protease inhibitor ecotin